jgi:hypothetical protein
MTLHAEQDAIVSIRQSWARQLGPDLVVPGRARVGGIAMPEWPPGGRRVAAAGQRAGRRQYLSIRGVGRIEKHLPC